MPRRSPCRVQAIGTSRARFSLTWDRALTSANATVIGGALPHSILHCSELPDPRRNAGRCDFGWARTGQLDRDELSSLGPSPMRLFRRFLLCFVDGVIRN